ncbi:MAG: hypothetical protein ABIR66_00385 [Saprospiraceae bacterium]
MHRLNLILISWTLFMIPSISAQRTAEIPWWKKNNLRVIQFNLPDYEASSLDPDSLLVDLQHYAANTLIINAGGIMAFYPSKLNAHYINPYMKPNTLKEVIDKCHRADIKVMVRFDFSRIDKTIYDQHPDWAYIDKNGKHMINTDKYVTCINAPYVQDEAFKIIGEVIGMFPVDGIFLNSPGYLVNNSYELYEYHGIDQNEYDKKRFFDWSGGMILPLEEERQDPVYLKYLDFKKYTQDEWQKKLAQVVKSKNPDIAICTYSTKYVDIIRQESQTNSLPYFPYNSSDNVNSTLMSYPEHIVSNASIQQISFQSRYNAIEPEEIEIRLWENIANGSGLDISLMGDMRGYEDERNYSVIKKIYNHHKRFEKYYGKYQSIAQIAVIEPGWWPRGVTMQEYRGVQLMLMESHVPFDRIEDSQIGERTSTMGQYKLIILPDVVNLNERSIRILDSLNGLGISLIATNNTFKERPDLLLKWFGVKSKNSIEDCTGQYISIPDHKIFSSLTGQSMIMLKFNLTEYDMTLCDQTLLPVLSKGRPGPPEMIGGHAPTGYYTIGIKNQLSSRNAIVAVNLGKLYYLHGYEEHKNILLNIIRYLFPDYDSILSTDAHPRVETVLQAYSFNEPSTYGKTIKPHGMILHLMNLTGFSGNTYFQPIPQPAMNMKIKSIYSPSRIWDMENNRTIPFTFLNGVCQFICPVLKDYKAIVIDK